MTNQDAAPRVDEVARQPKKASAADDHQRVADAAADQRRDSAWRG